MATPGATVGSGALITPGGAQGPQGSAGGSQISANANNKATLGTDNYIMVQGTAAGVAATSHAQTVSGDDPQLTNARAPTLHAATHAKGGSDFVAPIPSTDSGNLLVKGSDSLLYMATELVANCITTALIANGAVTGAKIAGTTITNANLAAGVAVANLGFTPVNRAGDDISGSQFNLRKDAGLASGTWNAAPLVISTLSSSGVVPAIGFNLSGVGAAGLYYDASSVTFRYMDSGGNTHIFCDNLNDFNYNNNAKTFYFSNNSVLKLDSNIGLAASSWSGSKLLLQSVNTSSRPGIGFNVSGYGYAAFLYLDSDGKFRYIDNSGNVHTITSS